MEQQSQQLTPEQDALEHVKAGRDKPFLEERFIDSFKGRGVFTHKAIEPSTFVVEYRGNISSHKNMRKYGDTLNNYSFEFSWIGTQWCIDASKEDGTLGRLVNDNHTSPNCEMKKIVYEGKPHLCLFAMEKISPGEEITYNYGDSSYPWRSKLEESSASSSSDDEDDDEELSDSGPSHSHDHFPDINTQLDLRDNLHFADFDYSHEMTGTFMLQPENAASSFDELSWDGDHRPSRAAPNSKGPSNANKNYCYVCGKAVAKIIRHLLRHADEEPDIAKALALPKTSKDRKKLFAELRKRGNYQHATRVSDELEPDVEQDSIENCDAEDDEESDLPLQQSDAAEQQSKQLTPEQDALKHIKACRDKPFVEERFIDPYKGRGVFARESIEPSTFVVEYRGRIILHRQTRERKCGDSLNNYLFDFSWNRTKWRIDSTEEDGTLGRLVNDDHTSPNCEMKKVVYKGKPHLCLFAVKKISPGEEITFNYGNSSYPWRSKDEDSPYSCDEDHKPSTSNRQQSQKFTKFDPSKKQSASRREQDKADSSSDESASDEESKDPSFTNKNYCYVCGCAQTKISRHLLTHRHEEPDIAAVLRVRKNSKERKALLQKLRDRGNIQHNREVLKTHCGELKVRRRNSNVPITARTFASCIYCKSMYVRKDMWRHVQKCSAKKLSEPHTDRRKVMKLLAAAESTDPQNLSANVTRMLNTLKKDEVSFEVWNDSFLLQLAQCLYPMSERKESTVEDIRQRLRQMGRLLLALKKKSICSFEDAIKPQNFSIVVEAVRELTGFNEETKSYDRPGVMKKLGNSLKRIGDINFARAWKEDADTETIREAEIFMKLCEEEWGGIAPSKSIGNNLPKSKVKTMPTIPFIHDVQLFYHCLEETAANATQSLTLYECSPVYMALLRVTVAQVAVLNKDMSEVSKVTLKSFQERSKTLLQEDAAVSQSQLEQILSKHTMKIDLVSDSHQKVGVTLTTKLLTALTLLVNKRDTCGVHKDNPFLFGSPDTPCTSFCSGQQCTRIFIGRCGAKNTASIRSAFFHKHILRFFQILSLTDDELGELAKVLGCNIQTDRGYYQRPEAAVDLAKIFMLLSAMENGSFDRFEGKSFEETEIPDELEPDVEPVVEPEVEQKNPEHSDAEEDIEESERFCLLRGIPFTKGYFSVIKRRIYRARNKKRESKNKASELDDEENEEVNTEKEMPESSAAITPEETVSHSNVDSANISFSDDDEDMNVDFDMDTDEDDVRNEENNEDASSAAMPLITDVTKQSSNNSDATESDSSPNKLCSVADLDETTDMDPVGSVEKGGEQENCMDVDSRGSSGSLNTEQKNKVSAAVTRMKEVKILIPKLDRERVSQLLSGCSSVKSPEKDQPTQDGTNQHLKTSASTNTTNEPNYAKATQMNCSHCKKSMLKGQTAYQKKGYTDVFCSKDCLFQMFPINKPVTRTCHYCHKVISQPLDLIMAAVDVKGTMKDFCSPACLISFKSNTVSKPTSQRLCSMCNKTCTTTTLNGTLHTFCSNSCQEDFSNAPICENCSSTCCNKPLNLRLEWATKTICSQKCLDEFKEKFEMPHPCTMCQTSLQIPDMVDLKSSENMVELFCSNLCVTSYMLRPATCKGKKHAEPMKRKSKPLIQIVKAQEGGNAASAAADATPTLILADSCVFCCKCGKKLPKGETLHQAKSSLEVFCSAKCLSEKHPHQATKRCHNCFQVIMRPHNMILAPVDDSGTMKELCSNACLASVNSRRTVAAPKPPPPAAGPLSQCRICSKLCYCKLKLTVDGCIQRICSDVCYTSALRINNLSTCDVCSFISPDKRFMLRAEDGSKIICTEECLVKYKQKIDTPRLCPMCQTPHQLSDMVENKNNEGSLDFFCSNRCMMVHKAQLSTVSGRNCPSPEECDVKEVKPLTSPEECDVKEVKPLTSHEECDVKEVKPSLQSFDFIKEEPTDEEYNVPSSTSSESIKAELQAGDDVAKEDLRISSVFSLTDSSTSTSTAPGTVSHMDLPASCSSCKQILMDRETVYQRKGHADVFCSTPCLLKFYQMKEVKKTCHFCLQGITQPEGVVQAPVDDQETMKDFCSQTCLSSFNYKKIVSTKTPLTPVVSQSQCCMCSRYCISMHELIVQDVVNKFCSNPCLLRFCNMNKLSICENCRSYCNTPLILKMEDGSKKLCRSECLAQFKQKIKTLQPCAMCRTSCLMSDMFENKNSEDMVELFCTNSCVMASKIQAVSASGTPLDCDHCGKTALPACHLAMPDASIRNFCTLTCAMAFKESQKDMNAATNSANQTQCDFLKEPEKLPCAQCQCFIKAAPKVIQIKGKVHFVCSLACSQEFNTVNNIIGKCEYCQNERIIRDVQKVDGKDCCFCSDACKRLFQHELEKEWGEHCSLCAYCLSISKMVVTATYGGNDQEFCSEDCSSNYNLLHCHIAKCDTCGRTGKLRQSLPLVGEVKHFCDLRCLLHFCNKKVQMVNTVPSPPRPSGTVNSFPIITNVVSLADALAKYSRARRHVSKVSVPDVQRKVVGHASIQTEPRELKNKSMLCTPLVHNKGVCCSTQTVDKEAQTDDVEPKVNVLPVPVPVYVPLPMNMYCQYTPKPVGLPLPLPVPVFLPEPFVTSVKEKVQPNLLEGNLISESERNGEEEGQEQETHTAKGFYEHKDHTSNLSSDLESDLQASLNNQDSSDTSFGSLSRPHTHKKTPISPPPPPLEMRGNPQSPDPAAPLSQHTVGKVHKKNKGRKRRRSGRAATEETSQREKKTSWKHHKLKSQHGADVWKRWVQWRKTNLALVSSRAVTLKENILCCSVTELSDSLCCFITEVRRPDGEPYSPSSLFYICLSIQQYLFDNGRMENIFSDQVYNKFSTEFTKILRTFKPSITASGYIHSRVEEEFLWDCKQLGAYSPIVLLNTLLFFCCKYFGFTTVEQHRQLSFAHVMRCTKTNHNNTKTTFLRFYPPISINEADSDTDGAPTKKRKKTENMEHVLEMMENTENPLRCPVRLYEFYLSKCSESVRQRSDLFYLQPDHRCVPNSPLWFSSTPLDDSIVEATLVRTLTVRELQNQRAFILKEKHS